MEFIVEFYETESRHCPVQEFLDGLKDSDPDDFAIVLAGLAKLRNSQYHREPLSKALGGGLFELRHVGKLNTRVLWFFMKGRRIILLHAIRNKGQSIPRAISTLRGNACVIGEKESRDERDQFRPLPREALGRSGICRPL